MIIDWDDAYANGAYIEAADTYPALWNKRAAEFRAGASCRLDLSYGDNPREVLDVFYPTGTPEGLMVFVHGGYWRAFDKSTWSHLAVGAVERGWAVAMPGYPLAPEARISDMAVSIAKAIEFAAGQVAGPVCLSGHSAGGHLVSRMLCNDADLPKFVQQRIQSVMSISGLHDLRPLLKTAMNAVWCMDKAEAVSESPALHEPLAGPKIHCWVGSEERPEFLRQNDLLVNIWSGLGADISGHHVSGRHHFNVIDELTEADSAMLQRLLTATSG